MSVTLIVDIGSNSVGAALVSVSKSTVPKVLFSIRLPTILPKDSEKVRSLSVTLSTLESVLEKVGAEHVSIQKTSIIFSSPWYTSQTKAIKREYTTPTLITRRLIEDLTKETDDKFTEGSVNNKKVIERQIIHTKLNGYNTSNPYNKKAVSLETVSFTSFMEKETLNSICRVIEKYFHNRNSKVSSFSLATFNVISSILPAESDFLIVDVRGEVTDVSLVLDSALIKNVSFAQGKNALAQAVADSSGQSTTAALSLISTALGDHGEQTVQEDVLKSSEAFKQSWLQSYTKTIQEISAGAVIPPTIFLLSDIDVETFFENILKEARENGKLNLLKHLNLKSYLDTTSVSTDSFLALESIFATMM